MIAVGEEADAIVAKIFARAGEDPETAATALKLFELWKDGEFTADSIVGAVVIARPETD